MSDDQYFRDLLRGHDPAPRPGFRGELREQLTDEWHGRATITPAATARSGRPWWAIGAAAAAVVALVVSGLVWMSGRDDVRTTPPADSSPVGSTLPSPAPTTVPAPPASTPVSDPAVPPLPAPTTTPPPSSPATTTTPASTSPPPDACRQGDDAATAIEGFFGELVAARFAGVIAPLAPCLTEVPAQFTGSPPYCWDEGCAASRTFPRSGVRYGEVMDADLNSYWTASLAVSYLTIDPWTVTDVVERWRFTPDGDAWRVELSSIEEPFVTRDESLGAINSFLAALAAGDWTTAARLLSEGGQSPEERDDIGQLAPDDYTLEGVGAALERWCSAGCDTRAAASDELLFDGGYALVRNGQELRATWYEGYDGVRGVPILIGSPATGDDLMAGWPAPPTVSPAVPYLIPTIAVAGDPLSGEGIDPNPDPTYQQLWVDPADPWRMVFVTSNPDESPFHQNTLPITVVGWDDARMTWSGPDYESITLADPGGAVYVGTRGLDEWAAIDLAASLTRSADGLGWELADRGIEPLAAEWSTEWGGWTIRWPGAELSLGASGLEMFNTGLQGDREARLVDVGGATGWLHESDGRVSIAWTVQPGVTALFGYLGDADGALAIVRSLTEVDRAAWEAYAPADPSTNDGCNSLFC